MTCYNCENNRGVYLRDCLGCAVRMVKSARPSRKQQENMIMYLVTYGKFSREQIIEGLNDSAKATATELS